MHKHLTKVGEVTFDKIFNQKLGKTTLLNEDSCLKTDVWVFTLFVSPMSVVFTLFVSPLSVVFLLDVQTLIRWPQLFRVFEKMA